MKLIDLKRAKPDKTPKKEPVVGIGPEHEERPYCMRFTLEQPELEKLGVEPKVFSKMEPITATIVIEPITIRDIESFTSQYDRNSNKSVEFQITKIALPEMSAAVTSLNEALAAADKTRKKVT